jgi:hypothetical protein
MDQILSNVSRIESGGSADAGEWLRLLEETTQVTEEHPQLSEVQKKIAKTCFNLFCAMRDNESPKMEVDFGNKLLTLFEAIGYEHIDFTEEIDLRGLVSIASNREVCEKYCFALHKFLMMSRSYFIPNRTLTRGSQLTMRTKIKTYHRGTLNIC